MFIHIFMHLEFLESLFGKYQSKRQCVSNP